MFKDIYQDLKFIKNRFNQPILKSILFNRGFHSLMFYRIANLCFRYKIPIVPLIMTRFIQILYAVDIDYKSKIEGGVIIIHGVGVVIGEGAYIASNVIIYHGVTLGRKRQVPGDFPNDGFPIVGENVVLGAGSKIVGNVKIGNNCIIGPNVVLMKDVPPNAIVKVPDPVIKIN